MRRSRRSVYGVVASIFLHAGVLAVIFLSVPRDQRSLVEIDVVTLFQSEKPGHSEIKKVARLKNEPGNSAPRIEKEAQPAMEEIGEADLDPSQFGRAPTNDTEDYLARVRDQVSQHQHYPAPSRQLREQGTVKLRLTLDRTGALLKVELAEPSRFRRLNDAAMAAVARAGSFPPFPDSVGFEKWRISFPVRFTLAQN